MANPFSMLGDALSFVGKAAAAAKFGPDYEYKARLLQDLNRIHLQQEEQKIESTRRDQSLKRVQALSGLSDEASFASDPSSVAAIGGEDAGAVADIARGKGINRRNVMEAGSLRSMLPFLSKSLPGPKRRLSPEEAAFYGLDPGGEYDESFLANKAARANAIAGRAATTDRWENFPVKVTGIDPATGQPTDDYMPRGEVVGTKRLKPAPAAAVESLSKFDQAEEALRFIEQDLGQYQQAPLLSPIKKAMTGYELDRKKQALAVQLGRALGEVGVFTDQDRATYARLMGPGLILTEMAPEMTRAWFAETQKFLETMKLKRKEHFRKSFGYLPGEAVGGDLGLDQGEGLSPEGQALLDELLGGSK